MSQGLIEDLTEKVREDRKRLERKTLNIKELSQVLSIGETKCRELVRSKAIGSIKVGNRYLIPISAVDTFINNSIGKEF